MEKHLGKEKKGSEVLKQMCQPRLDLHLNRELEFAKGGQGHHTKCTNQNEPTLEMDKI